MTDIGYTVIYEPNAANNVSTNELKSSLEKGKDEIKISTMKRILITILNGEPLPDLLMHIIRFVMPSKNKELKKLLYFYWEICPKYDSSGKMRHEMILVCNAIQRDLQHSNEFVRGNTLRFLCKLKEPELLETLVPNVRQCLDHRHAYVRKNAVFALYCIHKVSELMCPDADELIYRFLYEENDSVCKRNAFVCLGDLNREATLQYLQDNLSVVETLDPLLQLAFIEFVRKDSVRAPELVPQYTQLITEIVETSATSSVVYEAASSLTVLSSSVQSIVLAASKFIDLVIKESDNNVKIITLERIRELNKYHPNVLQDMALDVLRVLSCQDLDVRKKALDLSLQLVASRNMEEVVKLLTKEVQRASSSNEEKASDYRQLLINAIHQLAMKFAEVAANVIDLLLDSMDDFNTSASYAVVSFVKEVVEKFPDLRAHILKRLVQILPLIKSSKVIRGSLWILGEYCADEKLIQEAWKYIRASVGEVPILASEKQAHDREDKDSEHSGLNHKPKKPIVLPDGTYASENALTSETDSKDEDGDFTIRKHLLLGDFYLGAVLTSCMVKLILRLERNHTQEKYLNALKAEAILIMVSFLRVGESSLVAKRIDEDSADRIFSCIKYLTSDTESGIIQTGFLDDTLDAYKVQLKTSETQKTEAENQEFQNNIENVDDSINFRQFKPSSGLTYEAEDASIVSGNEIKREDLSSRLNKILQLTGYSDPIYAEAYIKVHQYDVILDILVVNQTVSTLRNLSVEFATLGDLKVVDKPSTINLGPYGFYKLQATVKVSSADTGVIFGNVVYDGQHSDESTIVILNDIHVDIMDYIKPATCDENGFRKMWNEFEWENKITIKCQMDTLKQYLDELMMGTNMNCLTPASVIGEECQFLSANLYSRSSFGEDALANVCIEKQTEGPIIGHVRLRSKSQGLALSLGDRVAQISKKNKVINISQA